MRASVSAVFASTSAASPPRALLHVAKLIGEAREANQWGIRFGEPEIDLDALRGFKEEVVGTLSGGIQDLCKRRKVEHRQARARFTGKGQLALEDASGARMGELAFEHAIVATGSTPFVPPVFELGDSRIMDSTGALALEDIPDRLLVIGGGYIGLELATVYAALGSRVTVVELLPGLLAGADGDLVRPLAKRLASQFEAIHLETKVASLVAAPAGITATLEGKGAGVHEFDRVLVARGAPSLERRPGPRAHGGEDRREGLHRRRRHASHRGAQHLRDR